MFIRQAPPTREGREILEMDSPVSGTRQSMGRVEVKPMTFAPIMWTVWGVLVASLLLLHVYRSSLEKNEDDQIFLDESFDHERAAQSVIVAKVQKVEPALRIAKWLALAMTVVVIVYYVRDILLQLNMIH